MASRQTLPTYAQRTAITITGAQLRSLYPRLSRQHPLRGCPTVDIAQTKDGQWWAEWRGQYAFWASRWYTIPKIVGERVVQLDEYVQQCVKPANRKAG